MNTKKYMSLGPPKGAYPLKMAITIYVEIQKNTTVEAAVITY